MSDLPIHGNVNLEMSLKKNDNINIIVIRTMDDIYEQIKNKYLIPGTFKVKDIKNINIQELDNAVKGIQNGDYITENPEGVIKFINCIKYIGITQKQPLQKSKEWLKQRKSCLTASDTYKITMAKNPNNKTIQQLIDNKTFVDKKGKFVSNAYTRWGERYEDIAVMIYNKMNNVFIYDACLLRHPTKRYIGASCDGFILKERDAECIEIKCPSTRIPEDNYIKREYKEQIQTQLFVTGFDMCNFFDCQLEEWEDEEEFLGDIEYFMENQHIPEFNESPKYYGMLAHFIDINAGNNKFIMEELGTTDPEMLEVEYAIKPFYVYSDLFNPELSNYEEVKENLNDKIQEFMNNNDCIFVKYRWWKLQKFVHVRKPKDPEWITVKGEKIKEFWDKVEENKKKNGIN